MGLMLGYKNHADSATLSGTVTWDSALPRDNMKSLPVSKVARTNTIAANTRTRLLTIDLGGFKSVDLIGLFGCVFPSLGAQLIFMASLDATFATTHEWRLLDGQPLYINSGKSRNCVVPVPGFVAQYWAIDVILPFASGTIDIGRLFVGEAFKPRLGVDFGAQTGIESSTIVQSSLSGVDYFDTRPKKRTKAVKWSWLSEHEAYKGIKDIQNDKDVSGEVVVCDDELIMPSFVADQHFSPVIWEYTGATHGTDILGHMDTPDGRTAPHYIECLTGATQHCTHATIPSVTVQGKYTFLACVMRNTHSLYCALRLQTGTIAVGGARAVFDYSTGDVMGVRSADGWTVDRAFSERIVGDWFLIGMTVTRTAATAVASLTASLNLLEAPDSPDSYTPAFPGHQIYNCGHGIFPGERTAPIPGIEAQETFLARFRQLSASEYPYLDTHAAAVEFVEVV